MEQVMELAQILNCTKNISPSAKILPKLLELLDDPNSSMTDIADLIKIDAALAGEVIRVSNTVHFAAAQKHESIEEAVNRIGFSDVHKIVGAISTLQIFQENNPLYKVGARTLWERSLRCGIIMHSLAEELSVKPETAYTIGLMHNIGIATISQFHHDQGIEGYSDEKYPNALTPNDERELLGFHNAEIAEGVLQLWKFPAEMCRPIYYQNIPMNCQSFPKQACLLSLARSTLEQLEEGLDDLYNSFDPDPEIMEYLGLDPEEVISATTSSEETFQMLTTSI